MTVIVKIRVTTLKVEYVEDVPFTLNSQPDMSPQTGDFLSLPQNGSYSDVTLIVGGKEYKAHKAILATRCLYFASIFASTFKEAVESQVTIEDIEPDDFDYILGFIYSGQHSKDSKSKTTGLLMAADRLGLSSIVVDCEEHLSKNITVDNCLNLFYVADLCSRDSFKSRIKVFIKNNMEKIMETESWKNVKLENTLLVANIVESIFRI